MWRLLDAAAAGDRRADGYGTSLGPPLDYPLLDEQALALPAGTQDPPPVAVFPVDGAPGDRAGAAGGRAVVVAGDGDGLVDLAGLGVLDGERRRRSTRRRTRATRRAARAGRRPTAPCSS